MPSHIGLRKLLKTIFSSRAHCKDPRPEQKYDFAGGLIPTPYPLLQAGNRLEGFCGISTCPDCLATTRIYRAVRMLPPATTLDDKTTKPKGTMADEIRFEQEQKDVSGRIVSQVTLTFNDDFGKMKRQFADRKKREWKGAKAGFLTEAEMVPLAHEEKGPLGKPCEVMEEKFFASLVCFKCGHTKHFYNVIVQSDDNGYLRWFLRPKPVGSTKGDIERYSEDSTSDPKTFCSDSLNEKN